MALGTDGLLTVVGDFDTITDDKASGTLTVRLSDKLVVGNRVYAPIDQTVNLNPNDGTFSIKLPATGDTGVTYRFELVTYAYVNGQREHFEESFNAVLTADDGDAQGVVQYKDLAPVATPGIPQTFLTRTAADSRYLMKSEVPELPSDFVTEADLAGLATATELTTGLASKVSSTTYVTGLAGKADKSAVDSLTTAVAQKANTSALSTVALTGSYSDLANKPAVVKSINGTAPDANGNVTVAIGGGGGGGGNILVLAPGAPIPEGTPNGTIIMRRAS